MNVLRCPLCEERGRKGAILAKLAVDNGQIELWCRKCRKPIEVVVSEGRIRFKDVQRKSDY
nr:MAG TPA: cysteine-rich protein [Bacteriophage sp.]